MRLTLLGSGNAAGMPLYGCVCERCQTIKDNEELHRGPACALIEVDNKKYLIDAGLMDISRQYPSGTLDGIFLTHFHPDHVQGLFHLRWGIGQSVPVYCPPDKQGCGDLFNYSGILDFQEQRKFESFSLDFLRITPLPLIHSKVTFGYQFEYQNQCIVYLTDTKGLPPKTQSILEASSIDLLVIDTSFPTNIENSGHNNLSETLQIHQQLKPKRTVLTHIGHDLDVWLSQHSDNLPESVITGHDNFTVYPY